MRRPLDHLVDTSRLQTGPPRDDGDGDIDDGLDIDEQLHIVGTLRVEASENKSSSHAALRYAHAMLEMNTTLSKTSGDIMYHAPRLHWAARDNSGCVIVTNSLIFDELLAHLHAVSTALAELRPGLDAMARVMLRRIIVWQAREARNTWIAVAPYTTMVELPRGSYTPKEFGAVMNALPDVVCLILAVDQYDETTVLLNSATSPEDYARRGSMAYATHELSPGSMLWTLHKDEMRAKVETIAGFCQMPNLLSQLRTTSGRALASTLLALGDAGIAKIMDKSDREQYLYLATSVCDDRDVRSAIMSAAGISAMKMVMRGRYAAILSNASACPACSAIVLADNMATLTSDEIHAMLCTNLTQSASTRDAEADTVTDTSTLPPPPPRRSGATADSPAPPATETHDEADDGDAPV